MAAAPEHIYLIGGNFPEDNTHQFEIWNYSLMSKETTLTAFLKYGRSKPIVHVIDDSKLIVYGGF